MNCLLLRKAVLLGVILAMISIGQAFQLNNARRLTLSSAMTMNAEDTPAKEWVGAKKFSMKDRYTETIFSNEQIAKILPHRYPFLLVDRVVEFEPGKRAVGIKCVSANEPQFTGHFPDRPIMPGVLMIEAMAQLGGIICLSPPINNEGGGRIFFFTGVNGVRWKSPVTPGLIYANSAFIMKS